MVQVKCLDPTDPSYNFLYCPSFPAAVLFSALFGLTTIAHVAQAIHYRKKFCWVVIMAGIWETSGLTLRVFSVLNTTSAAFGTPSQILILLAPIWINAFLYVLMSRFVYFFVPDKSVGGISAQRLSLCFVLLDITAFLMQAGGGLIINSDSARVALIGIHVYMGGIGLQQVFICGFIALVVRFHYKMLRTDGPTDWKRPLYVMYASLALITIRIIFRLIEFSSGVLSPITMHEAPFYCLEALPMFVALLLWNVFHPGQVLVGPESEFPKKVKKSKGTNAEKDPEAYDLHLLSTPSPPV
ncbi:RTA1 like protein-domain-containing protein [Mycena rosella]|uniref:RTA1 like protein-domain-containing protein n=1 Tax=Mycena rosella TaxID=1033263 RepID=A0AAD7CTP4_MYCRO|nr:RTA1 like protein-domain-containing protein [Mycena rosella]